jgi:hypothetical protein
MIGAALIPRRAFNPPQPFCPLSSYNIYEACEKMWGTELKQMILDRDGTLVVRPDSGEPKIIVVEVLTILEKQFGSTTNEQVKGDYTGRTRKES